MKILLIDDEQSLLEMMTHHLTSHGHAVASAQTGQQGWETFSGARGMFDLIITDISMPAVGGIDLVRRIRANDVDVPVIAMSGNPDAVSDELSNLDVWHLLLKPFDLDEILPKISQVASISSGIDAAQPVAVRHQSNAWYAFHFGSAFVYSGQFDPRVLHKRVYEDCYVMMADFCSFTSFFRATRELTFIESLMNQYYTRLRKAIHCQQGMLDKIMGDGVIAVWGIHYHDSGLIRNVVKAAYEISRVANEIADKWQSHVDVAIEPRGLRIGVSKGDILVTRRDAVYPGLSLLGDAINLASRLQSVAGCNHLLCTQSVYDDISRASSASETPEGLGLGSSYVDARNYGPVRVWDLSLCPEDALSRRLVEVDAA